MAMSYEIGDSDDEVDGFPVVDASDERSTRPALTSPVLRPHEGAKFQHGHDQDDSTDSSGMLAPSQSTDSR